MKIDRSRRRGLRATCSTIWALWSAARNASRSPPLGHRQHADEVGQPHVRRGLQLRVLVQEVVDLPGLVGDPDVERLLADEVVEDHEVRAEDLVEAAQHLERVELVLARFRIDARGLGGELRARRMHRLAAGFEQRRQGAGRASGPRGPGRGAGARARSRRRARRDRGRSATRRAAPGAAGQRRAPRCACRGSGGAKRPAKSWISWLTRTGWRALGMCPRRRARRTRPP